MKKFSDDFIKRLIEEVLSRPFTNGEITQFFLKDGHVYKSSSVKSFLSRLKHRFRNEPVQFNLSPEQLKHFYVWVGKAKEIPKVSNDNDEPFNYLPWSVPSIDGVTKFENLDYAFKICRNPKWDDTKPSINSMVFCGEPVAKNSTYSFCDKCKETLLQKTGEK